MGPVPQSLRSYNILCHPSCPAHRVPATRRRAHDSGHHLLSVYCMEVKCCAKHFVDTLSCLAKGICLRSEQPDARLSRAGHSCHFLADTFPFHDLWPGSEGGGRGE